jgi:hypothetical protein
MLISINAYWSIANIFSGEIPDALEVSHDMFWETGDD